MERNTQMLKTEHMIPLSFETNIIILFYKDTNNVLDKKKEKELSCFFNELKCGILFIRKYRFYCSIF